MLSVSIPLIPTVTHRFLPGCHDCGLPHPRAMQPPRASDNCAGCGQPLPSGDAVTVESVLTGQPPLLARLALWAAEKLRSLENRL